MDPNLFGAPRTGAHALRIPLIDLALVDTALTGVAAHFASQYFGWSAIETFIGLFGLGLVAHLAVGVNTRFVQFIQS